MGGIRQTRHLPSPACDAIETRSFSHGFVGRLRAFTHLAGFKTRSVWYPNGAATKQIYLTVTHGSNDGGLIFDYHYQSAVLSYDDIQKLYYYMMKMMFRGVEEPDITLGELISTT